MRPRVSVLVGVVALYSGAGGPAAGGGTLTVFAAASLTESFREIADSFQADPAGTGVRLNLGGTEQLAMQLEQGAPADVFASADLQWMEQLRQRDLIEGSPVVFAGNRLVVVVPRRNPAGISRLEDLARPGLKLVLAAEAVPAGHYSREALARLGRAPGFPSDYRRKVLANVVSEEENVKGVLAKVQLGEADAGVVYHSDALAVAGSVRELEIPDPYNVAARYPIAVVRGSPASDAARRFVSFVLSATGQAVLARHGLVPAARLPTPATGG